MTVEICIDHISSALAAQAGGAARIEVCGALDLDGITPSYGLVEQCVALGDLAVMMLIRPHAGGFCYGAAEVATIRRDIQVAHELGVHGVVIGVLQEDGRIDREACLRLIEAARPLSVTFHRAFDLTPDPLEAFDTLLDLGVDRLLTSGQAHCARDGAAVIRALVQRAGTALHVMAGAGIRAVDVQPLVRATGVRELHASASVRGEPSEHCPAAHLVRATRETRSELVRALVEALRDCQS